MHTLRDGTTTTDPRLDRLEHQDPLSRNYDIRDTLTMTYPRSYTWRCPYWLDQGREGACVGFAWAHERGAHPATALVDNTVAQALYKRAQQLDQWEGEAYEGTSVLAGAQAAKEKGWIREYRWAFSFEDVILTLGYKGPIVFGMNWYQGMYQPGPDGFIRRTGSKVGGHAILGRAVRLIWKTGTTTTQKRSSDWLQHLDLDRSWIILHNSWGQDWGTDGTCKLSLTDLRTLLQERGDACVPVTRAA